MREPVVGLCHEMTTHDGGICYQKGKKLIKVLHLEQEEEDHEQSMNDDDMIEDAGAGFIKIFFQKQINDSNGKQQQNIDELNDLSGGHIFVVCMNVSSGEFVLDGQKAGQGEKGGEEESTRRIHRGRT